MHQLDGQWLDAMMRRAMNATGVASDDAQCFRMRVGMSSDPVLLDASRDLRSRYACLVLIVGLKVGCCPSVGVGIGGGRKWSYASIVGGSAQLLANVVASSCDFACGVSAHALSVLDMSGGIDVGIKGFARSCCDNFHRSLLPCLILRSRPRVVATYFIYSVYIT